MASSMDRDLDEEDLDETSYERVETSDTDIDNDSDGRGSKNEKVIMQLLPTDHVENIIFLLMQLPIKSFQKSF